VLAFEFIHHTVFVTRQGPVRPDENKPLHADSGVFLCFYKPSQILYPDCL